MRLINKPPEKKKYFPADPIQLTSADNKLFIAHRSDEMIVTSRSPITYRAIDEANVPGHTASFYLLPDPYAECNTGEGFLLEEEEMMLYDCPPISNNSLLKI